MAKNEQPREMPIWFDGKSINEALFCDDFLSRHKIIYTNGAFFTPNGRVTNDLPLRGEIFEELKCCAVSNIPRKISNIVELMKLAALVEDFPPEQDCIHLANGTLTLDGSFTEGRPKIVRSRLPVAIRPDAPKPGLWLSFLDGLLYPEDIPTLQEFIGYCLIPSNKGQRMMVMKGSGGEGKSQIGAVLSALFGSNMKDGSIGKISENRFVRADLEHVLLCVDDDMRMEALRQTNYVKSIVTAQGKMDLERKGRQSYQGWMFARLLAFSNGDLQALFDRSDGFYRRQLVLTTRERPAGRVDDPDLAEKMKAEAEGIFLWAFEGLRRLVSNNFKFTESQRTRANQEAVKRDNNNVFDFLESEGYLERSGHEERIDHRSHAERGLLERPTVHEGVVARAMEKKGIISDRCELNRQIKADNALLQELRGQVKKLAQAVKSTLPALAEAMENLRKNLLLFCYQLGYLCKGKERLNASLNTLRPALTQYNQLAKDI